MGRPYPADRAVHDWERIDRVLLYMIPQGFSAKEVEQAVGVPYAQVINRANALGAPFSLAFGPESKCRAGHKLQEVGYEAVTSERSGRNGRRCNVCYAKHKANANEARRRRRGSKPRRPVLLRPGDNSATRKAYQAAVATNAIIALHEEYERAATWWAREAIQQQIEQLQKRVTA